LADDRFSTRAVSAPNLETADDSEFEQYSVVVGLMQ